MIFHTFCHLHRIGLKREQALWDRGILSWEDFFHHLTSHGAGPAASTDQLKRELELSFKNYRLRDPAFFSERLPSSQIWRLFGEFKGDAVYLDIETTGLSIPTITTISLYDGKDIRCYVYGKNLEDFSDEIGRYKLIITYNGICFDVPVIESFFKIKLPQAHIDLRYVLKRLGYSGGLKGCEKKAGISRGDLDGVDGYFAVLLWNDFYHNGNPKALETLLAYNIEDVVNLEKLMIMAYNLNIGQFPSIQAPPLPESKEALHPFQPDVKTIERIRQSCQSPALPGDESFTSTGGFQRWRSR